MIRTKQELYEVLEADRKANNIKQEPFSFKKLYQAIVCPNLLWKFIVTLRKCEYYKNSTGGGKILYAYYLYRWHKLSVKLGFSIPFNVFGPGLSLAHHGMIVANAQSKVGRNCRLMHGVTLGATGGGDDSPEIGDNVFIGTNAVVLGGIKIADNVSIAAGSVVTKSCLQEGAMLAGVPATIKKEKCEIWWKMNGLELN